MQRKLTTTPAQMQSDHLSSCASNLIDTFETPQQFLEFLTQCMTWVAEYNYPASMVDTISVNIKADTHFILTELANFIVPNWFEGGKDPVEHVARGIDEFDRTTGGEALYQYLAFLLVTYGDFSIRNGFKSVESLAMEMQRIAFLVSMAEALQANELSTKKTTN